MSSRPSGPAGRLACGVTAAVVVLTAPLAAQLRDSTGTVTRLADGVYAIVHAAAVHDWPTGAADWPNGNTGVIIGKNAVLVIDSDYLPSRARADIALIRQLTSKPIRFLVNTHWHGDHTHGNGVYRERFPDLRIVGARDNAHYISLNQERWPRIATAAGSSVRQNLARLDSILTAGKDSTGRTLTPAERDAVRSVAAEHRNELTELAEVRAAPPTVLFDRDTTIDLGRRKVVLRNWGRANSPADVTIYLPAERILFTGDIVVHPVPYVFGAYPIAAIDVLRQLERLPVVALVPGHGPVMTDHAYTRQVRELFEATRDRVEALMRQGKTEAEVVKTLDLSDWRGRFVREDDPDAVAGWDQSIIGGLIGRTYQCLSGSRC